MALKKRGVSPFISEIIIITFAIAVGALIIIWATDYTKNTGVFVKEKSTAGLVCDGLVDFQANFAEYNQSTENLTVILENNKNKKIIGLVAKVSGDSKRNIFYIENISLDPLDFYTLNLNVSYNVSKIIIIPQIEYNKQKIYCAKQLVEYVDIINA